MTMNGNMVKVGVRAVLLGGSMAAALILADIHPANAEGHGQGGSSASSGGGGGGGGGSDSGRRSGGSSAGQGQSTIQAEEEEDGPPEWAGESGGNPDKGADQTSGGGRPDDKGGRPEGVGGGDEDSDRPDWAGTPGGAAGRGSPPNAGGGGDLYGDLYVILRDDQGVPILSEEGFVQPIAADGSLIPLDEEGHVIDETLVQEVDFGRLNVGRSPEDVLDRRTEEVIDLLNSATEVTFDPAGRLVVIVDGEENTIDSPLENLAIYVALMETGTIEGVDNPALGDLFLVDGVKDAEDLEAASAFLAAATDKTGEFTTDEIAYMNLILGIDTDTIEGTEVTYSAVDYSAYTYDRETAYGEVTTTVLVQQDDGSWVPTEVNIYEEVFGSENDTAEDGTLEAFTQAADDARMVIEYIHEYSVPEVAE